MTISTRQQILFGLIAGVAIFFAVQFLCWFSPKISAWNEQIADKILGLKSYLPSVRPDYTESIVIVDLNNSSLQALDNYHPGRAYYAKVIRNLSDMGVALQAYDIVFAGHRSAEADADLVEAARNAENAIFGMVFRLDQERSPKKGYDRNQEEKAYLSHTKWEVVENEPVPGLYYGNEPVISFAALGSASKGMGFLTLTPDSDGVFRRLPLLVRYEGAVYPSFALKAACEFLNVPPANVVIGKDSIFLMAALRPGDSMPRNIKIPVDETGAMRVNFVGKWGRMKHYDFSDIYSASGKQEDWPLWQEEMKGKIVLISDTYTGSTDIGVVPVDSAYPLSGVHANAVHTILNEDFISDIRGYQALLVELLFAALLFTVYLVHSSLILSAFTFSMGAVYFCAAAAVLVFFNVLIPVTKPLLLMLSTWGGLFTIKSIQNAYERLKIQKAKEIAERELEIGRKIQADFLPSYLPKLTGWQMETYFKPAYQVSGDFYDVFELPGGRYHAVVIGDVCDHGVGSALFMAVLRSMVRIFSLQSSNTPESKSPEKLILDTVNRTNNYIAENHGDTGMFATMFIGFLNSDSGEMFYVNCGHEPPPLIRNGQIKQFLKPTGLPVGAMEDSPYTCDKIRFQKGDYIFLYTDGIIDALDGEGNSFGKERLYKNICGNHSSLKNLKERLEQNFYSHVKGGEVTDDVTFLALKSGTEHSV